MLPLRCYASVIFRYAITLDELHAPRGAYYAIDLAPSECLGLQSC